MSTAIMHSTAFYDFGDLHLKNHSSLSRSLSHPSNTVQQQTNSLVNVIGTPSSLSSVTTQQQQHHTSNNNNNSNTTSSAAAILTTNSNNNNLLTNLNNNTSFNGTVLTANSPTSNDHNHQHHPHHLLSNTMHSQQQQLVPSSGNNMASSTSAAATMLQQQINAAAAAVFAQHQQQQNQKMLLHNALTRAVSNPQGNVVSLVNSLIENLGHRKLERTQSEPLPQVNTSRYKTELCRPFEEAGECKYGEKCQFAHGMHELRNLQRHPKYKTELCRTFHSVGFCPYGPRCHFVHNAEEARNHNRAVHAAYVRAAVAAGQPIPLSPPMSMSTGSDRASPAGSLSPTNSMASFFPDQTSPTQFLPSAFQFPAHHSPPATPRNQSPMSTPPPGDDARLPIFNQLSSTIDAFNHLAM